MSSRDQFGDLAGPEMLFRHISDISRVVVFTGRFAKYPGYLEGRALRNIPGILEGPGAVFSKFPGFFGRSVPTKYEAAKASVQAICYLGLNPPNIQDFLENPSGKTRADGKRRKHAEISRANLTS